MAIISPQCYTGLYRAYGATRKDRRNRNGIVECVVTDSDAGCGIGSCDPVFVTVVVAYQYAKMKGLDGIREDVYQLILTAERAYNYGDNKQKLKYVVQEARKLLPNWLQVVLSDYILERTVRGMV